MNRCCCICLPNLRFPKVLFKAKLIVLHRNAVDTCLFLIVIKKAVGKKNKDLVNNLCLTRVVSNIDKID